jgi:hypothetical protein
MSYLDFLPQQTGLKYGNPMSPSMDGQGQGLGFSGSTDPGFTGGGITASIAPQTDGMTYAQKLAAFMQGRLPSSIKPADSGALPAIVDNQQRAYEQYLKAFNSGK